MKYILFLLAAFLLSGCAGYKVRFGIFPQRNFDDHQYGYYDDPYAGEHYE